MNHLSNDELERYWFKYRTEAFPHGIAMEKFCIMNKISYRALSNWERQMKNKVEPVEVTGTPAGEPPVEETVPVMTPVARIPRQEPESAMVKKYNERYGNSLGHEPKKETGDTPVKFMVVINATNGLRLSRKYMDYQSLLRLVQNLEGIC